MKKEAQATTNPSANVMCRRSAATSAAVPCLSCSFSCAYRAEAKTASKTSNTTATKNKNFNQILLVAMLALFCLYPAEAFASASSPSMRRSVFFGQRLRGGETSSSTATATHTASKDKRGTSSSTSPMTCVMQAPRILQSIASEDDGSNSNRNSRKNGQFQPSAFSSSSSSSSKASKINGFKSRGDQWGVQQQQQQQPLPTSIPEDRPVPVEYVAETKLPTHLGDFLLRAYRIPGAPIGQNEPCVIYSPNQQPPFGHHGQQGEIQHHIPVRIHDQCFTSEVFGSRR